MKIRQAKKIVKRPRLRHKISSMKTAYHVVSTKFYGMNWLFRNDSLASRLVGLALTLSED